MWTGPGPQCAIGGDTVAVRLRSEASGRRRVAGGKVRVKFTCTGLEAILLKPYGDKHRESLSILQFKDEFGKFVSVKTLDPAYCYQAGLCKVPEGLPELHVQVLGDAFEFGTP